MDGQYEPNDFSPDSLEMLSKLYELLYFLFYDNGIFCCVLPSIVVRDKLVAHFGGYID